MCMYPCLPPLSIYIYIYIILYIYIYIYIFIIYIAFENGPLCYMPFWP